MVGMSALGHVPTTYEQWLQAYGRAPERDASFTTLSGQPVAPLWAQLPVIQMSLLLLYHIVTAHTLWPAPVYCWLLLVSGWARRAAFLWAIVPVVAITAFEELVFHTARFAALVGYRLIGNAPVTSFRPDDMFPTNPMTHITPGTFLSTPSLWIGLAVAAIFLAAAVRLRRYRGPSAPAQRRR